MQDLSTPNIVIYGQNQPVDTDFLSYGQAGGSSVIPPSLNVNNAIGISNPATDLLDANLGNLAFSQGFQGAIPVPNSGAPSKPFLYQWFQAIIYAITSMIAYLYQKGVPFYNQYGDYYVGSIVNDGNGNLYRAILINGLNNGGAQPVTNTTYWQQITQPVASVFLTALYNFAKPTTAQSITATTVATAQNLNLNTSPQSSFNSTLVSVSVNANANIVLLAGFFYQILVQVEMAMTGANITANLGAFTNATSMVSGANTGTLQGSWQPYTWSRSGTSQALVCPSFSFGIDLRSATATTYLALKAYGSIAFTNRTSVTIQAMVA